MSLGVDAGRTAVPCPLDSAHLPQTSVPNVSYRKKVAVAAAWIVPGKYKDKRLVQGQAPVAEAGPLELALDKQDAGKKGGSEAGIAVDSRAGKQDGCTVLSQGLLGELLVRPWDPALRRIQLEGQRSRTEHSRRHTAVRTADRESRLAAADTAGSMRRSQAQL